MKSVIVIVLSFMTTGCAKSDFSMHTLKDTEGYLLEGQFELTSFSSGDRIVLQIGDTEVILSNIQIGVNTFKVRSATENGILRLKARNADLAESTLDIISY